MQTPQQHTREVKMTGCGAALALIAVIGLVLYWIAPSEEEGSIKRGGLHQSG